MSISFSARLAVAPGVLFRYLGDEGVLVNLNTEQYLGVNAVGARMWEVLGTANSIECAYERLVDEYEVEPAELRRDLEQFIVGLAAQHLIELHATDGASDTK